MLPDRIEVTAGTPIEEACNVGPVCGAELRSLGIGTLESLQDEGFESVYERWVRRYPDRIHTMAAYALLGAEQEVKLERLSPAAKARCRAMVKQLRAEFP